MLLHYHVTVTASQHYCISQSFELPPATTSVSHLTCPLPPHQSVIRLAHGHHISHLNCPLPLCHNISQSFDLPSTSTSLHYHVTMSPHHSITASVSHLNCPPRHHISQSFDLPTATTSVKSFELPSTTALLHQ